MSKLDEDVAVALIELLDKLPLSGTPTEVRAELELRERATTQLRELLDESREA